MRLRHAATALLVASVVTAGAAVGIALDRQPARPHAARPAVATAAPTPTGWMVEVNGAPVPSSYGETVAAALREAGIVPAAGHYVSVVGHHRLGPDGHPAQVLVDGRAAPLAMVLRAGDRISVLAGTNMVEPTVTTVEEFPPPAPSALYVGGRPGLRRLVVGRFSHEVVSSRVARPARIGRLVRPGAVALTFDDGPWSPSTKQVLALLERHHVHATFCMIGRQVSAHANLVRRMVRDGDDLCDHTWDHDLALPSRPHAQIVLEITRALHAIRRAAGGVAPLFFRAPGGNFATNVDRVAARHHLGLLRWTVDTRDWSRPGVHMILRHVYAELRPGGVILMHDGGGDRSESVSALRILLRKLPRMGYHFVLPPVPTVAKRRASVHN
jgi:peptidoglycan/xylan/chitin deacetylase (PgdA/CDA1 family)/sulfur carrier protein ThiS